MKNIIIKSIENLFKRTKLFLQFLLRASFIVLKLRPYPLSGTWNFTKFLERYSENSLCVFYVPSSVWILCVSIFRFNIFGNFHRVDENTWPRGHNPRNPPVLMSPPRPPVLLLVFLSRNNASPRKCHKSGHRSKLPNKHLANFRPTFKKSSCFLRLPLHSPFLLFVVI